MDGAHMHVELESKGTALSSSVRSSTAPAVVLHVDDNLASLAMAESVLENAGFSVVHASNGRDAVARFDDASPDVIIMDAVMPEMDGFEAIAAIRKRPGGEHVPILMTTALDDPESITRAYDEGATDFLIKPMNFFVLPHRVQYMLRSNATAEALRSSEAKLDNAQRIAKLGHWEWCVQSDDISFSGGFIRTMQIASGCNRMSWHSFMERVAEADRTALSEAVTHAIERGGPWSSEFTTQPILDCGPRTIRLEAEPLIDQDGNCTHMLGTVQDITERLNAQEQIHNLAYYDIVTGLPNRARLLKSLEEVLDRASRERTRFAVLFLDLDHFKQVNDTLGHDAGDALLQQVAERINNVLRESDVLTKSDDDSGDHTVARLGGDEFVVLLGSIRRPEDSARVAQRIAATIREPFRLGESEVRISTTIGISVYPADGKNSDSLLKHADVAMYHAKERGRDGYQFYSRGIHDLALDRLTLEKDLKQAITNNALTLVFQPKVNLATGQVSGCETLVRWNHPERGDISPVEFIPLAEETGLIVPLGQWVLKAACEQMQQWHAKGEAKFSVSVNCSAVQFTRGNMEREIEAALLSSGLDAAYLEIELTESLLMQDIDAGIASLERMKTLGVQVAIDDFGTGFSSLSYLKSLPADKLKIDRQFITDLASDAGDKAIVAAITSLSHDLGLTVVAEGVETGEQLDVLRRLECDEAQGYLFGKPLTADELIAWLDQKSSNDGHYGIDGLDSWQDEAA